MVKLALHLLQLCWLLAILVLPQVCLGFVPICGASGSLALAFHNATPHLPHARGTSGACEHAFAGEVAQPQANSSAREVAARSLASPRIARVGAASHLGMPKDLVASDGAVAWSASHSAYGRIVSTYADPDAQARYGTAVKSPFRLLGQIAAEDAELCWTRCRCFDGETGPWVSTDPLEIEGGLNLYGFDGAPTRFVDPRGLSVIRSRIHD